MIRIGVFICFWLIDTLTVSAGGDNRKDDSNDELLFVHVMWRHGVTIPPIDFVHKKLTEREALPQGLLENFNLGKLLRQEYIESNNQFLDPDSLLLQTYFRSTDFNRSLEAASVIQAAMFPLVDDVLSKVKGWPCGWKPVPTHSVPLETDYLLNIDINCSIFTNEMIRIRTIPSFQKLLRDNQDLFDKLSDLTGQNITTENVGIVYASLLPEDVQYNEVIPKWVTPELMEKMRKVSLEILRYKYSNNLLIRFRGGPLIQEVLDRMELKYKVFRDHKDKNRNISDETYGIDNLKFYAYSTRGMPIFWQLAALGDNNINGGEIPEFGSALIYELWNQNNQPHVTVKYFNGGVNSTAEWIPVQVEGCPKVPARCPMDKLRQRVTPYLGIKDWFGDCGEREPDIVGFSGSLAQPFSHISYQSMTVIFGIVIIVLTTIIILQFCIIMQSGKRRGHGKPHERSLLLPRDH